MARMAHIVQSKVCGEVQKRHLNLTKHFDGLVYYCSNSSASAMELLRSCTKPSIVKLLITDS